MDALRTADAAAILIVIVRYRTPLEESETIRSLAASLAEGPAAEADAACRPAGGGRGRFAILIWDNSPEPQAVPPLPFAVEYHPSRENVGVSGAYNFALERAEAMNIPWLLLLDQDTVLPPGFLDAMDRYATTLEADPSVAAVAPTVLVNAAPASPKIMSRWRGAADPPAGATGPCRDEVIVMNSGMLLRAEALRRIGGYSMDFWLDFSDRYVCHMLHRHGYGAWLAGDLRLEHDVSLMTGRIPAARYEILMGAQDAYFTQFRSPLRNAVFCQRMLRNAWRERRTDPERSRVLLRLLRRRLTVPRGRRLEEWRREAAAQRLGR
jgi:GT2 family glycosyltransferase